MRRSGFVSIDVWVLLIGDDALLGGAVRDQIAADGHGADWVQPVRDAADHVAVAAYERVLLLAFQEVLNRETPGNDNRSALVGAHEEYLPYIVRAAAGAVLIRSHDAAPFL